MNSRAPSIEHRALKIAFAIFLAVLLFGWNLASMAPTITGGDSAELSLAQSTLGVAHSPGYPLFSLAGKLFSALMPMGNPAYRTNIFSALCGFGAAIFCFLLIENGTNSIGLALCATLIAMLAPTVRQSYLTTEVFALNSFCFLALLWLGFRAKEERDFNLIAFLVGLGLGNQHTLILSVPALALLWLRWYLKSPRNFFPVFARLLFFGVLGISIYLFLPIRSLREPVLDWEDPQTFQRFWQVVTRARYGMFQLAQGSRSEWTLARCFDQTRFFLVECARQITWPVAILIFSGFVRLWFKERMFFFAWLALVILCGPFFLILSNVSIHSGYEILLRFLPLPLLALIVGGAIGCASFRFSALLMLACLPFLPKTPSLRAEFSVRDHGVNLLKTLPPDALLFSDRADESEFSLAYLLSSENLRKDASFIDCNAGVTRSAYGDDYYRIWGKPRLARREMREKEMIAQSPAPVFYATVEPEMLPIPKSPEGLLYRAKPLEASARPWLEFYISRENFLDAGYREKSLMLSDAQVLQRYFSVAQKWPEAEREFAALRLIAPEHPWDHQAAILCMENKNDALAEKYLFRALEKDPERDKVLCNLAYLYERRGRNDLSEQYYHQAIAANPTDFLVHYNLGVLYWKQKRWPEVIREFETVLKLNPNHLDAQQFLLAAKKRSGLGKS